MAIQNADNMNDIFINTLDREKFRATNNIWNQIGLNSRENVGTVSDLINQKPFKNKEDWEEYYYEHGRSKKHLTKIGEILYDAIKSTLDITLEECIECVRFRVICETWNGIIIRENNTIKQLEIIYDNIFQFKKTSGDVDFNYAVDYEMFYDNKIICGIQIKPTSYLTSNAEYIIRAKKCNEYKNFKYSEKYNIPVITLTSEINGIITSHSERLILDKFYREFFHYD